MKYLNLVFDEEFFFKMKFEKGKEEYRAKEPIKWEEFFEIIFDKSLKGGYEDGKERS